MNLAGKMILEFEITYYS